MEVKIINTSENCITIDNGESTEQLVGYEKILFEKKGYQAVLNRRAYEDQQKSFFEGAYKDLNRNKYTKRKYKEKATQPIVEDDYDE